MKNGKNGFKNFSLGVAFDASHVKGKCADYQKDLDFHNLEATEHYKHLEFDYEYFRNIGVNFFRDGSLMYKTCPRPKEYNWNYLDRVAKQEGQIQISLSHYEFPTWMTKEEIKEGKFSDFLSDFTFRFCERYKHFHSIIPCVEIGYWCHMISTWNRWHPFLTDWWEAYKVVMNATIASAKVLRTFGVKVALSEPFGLETPIEDQARPFVSLLGLPDPIERFDGNEDLLQILGMNYYRLDTVVQTTNELKQFIPNKELMIAETGNCHHPAISWKEWLAELDSLGKIVDTVVWSPAIEMSNFEYGQPTGGYLLERCRPVDKAKVVNYN